MRKSIAWSTGYIRSIHQARFHVDTEILIVCPKGITKKEIQSAIHRYCNKHYKNNYMQTISVRGGVKIKWNPQDHIEAQQFA